jgi:tetratricopeptide (TPR) repeat protein
MLGLYASRAGAINARTQRVVPASLPARVPHRRASALAHAAAPNCVRVAGRFGGPGLACATMNDRMVGPFRLMELRRSGLAGDVHVAWDTRLNQRVLVTLVPKLAPDGPGVAGRGFPHFIEAMRRLSGMRNPLLLLPTEFASPGGQEAWYATEFAEGPALRALSAGVRKLPWRQAAMILHEVAAALAHAHARHIAHGQLSPERIYLERTGRVVIGGFDVLARVAFADGGGSNVDLVEIFEQPQYVAPEGLLRRPPSAPGDVFSLGAMTFELLSGAPPFASGAEVLAHVQARRSAPDPPGVDDLPDAFRELIREMLATRADQRPLDAGAVRDRTGALLKEFLIHDVRASLGAAFQRVPQVFGAEPLPDPSGVAADPVKPKKRSPKAKAKRSAGAEVSQASADGTRGAKQAAAQAKTGIPAELAVQLMTEPMSRGETRERSASSSAMWLLGAMLLGGAALAYGLYGNQLFGGAKDERGTVASAEGPALTAVGAEAALDPNVPLAEAPSEDPVELSKEKATVLLSGGKAGLAETQLRLGLEQGGKSDPALHMLLAESLEQQGKLDQAVEAWLAADASEGASATAGRLAAGFALARANRCDAALPMFAETRERGLDTAEVYKLVGNCELMLGQAAAAVSSLRSAVERDGSDVDSLVPLALALSNLGKGDEAAQIFAKVLEIDPDNAQAKRVTARLDAVSGDPLKALAALGAGDDAQAPPATGAGDLELAAFAAYRAGYYKQAADAYARAIEAAGDAATPGMLKNYAMAEEKAGRAADAAKAYARAIRAAPEDPELPYLLGRLEAARGRRDEAIALYEDSLAKGPGQVGIRFELGVLQLEDGRNQSAAKTFGALAREQPGNLEVLQNLGKAQVEAGQQADAVDTFQRMAELQPDDPGPVLTAAALMQRLGREADAVAALQEACRRGATEACQ